MSAVLTDSHGKHSEGAGNTGSKHGRRIVWTWDSMQKRQLLRQDIEEYPTLYYKMDQKSREKYIFMDYSCIEIPCTDLSRHSMSDDAEKFAQPLLC